MVINAYALTAADLSPETRHCFGRRGCGDRLAQVGSHGGVGKRCQHDGQGEAGFFHEGLNRTETRPR
ncbi:MAG TPA: hypothetical protein ENI30_13685 [Gammaproteobacteria bacterium]|nr:hypothetical protein [Gammaproteobacteria bacterium]